MGLRSPMGLTRLFAWWHGLPKGARRVRCGRITPEVIAWAESAGFEVEAYKIANPNWLAETKPVSELLAKRPKR